MTSEYYVFVHMRQRCLWGRTRSQLAVLHLLHQEGRFRPPQQPLHIPHASAEAHSADAHPASEAVGALHELVCVLGTLPAQAGGALTVGSSKETMGTKKNVTWGTKQVCNPVMNT